MGGDNDEIKRDGPSVCRSAPAVTPKRPRVAGVDCRSPRTRRSRGPARRWRHASPITAPAAPHWYRRRGNRRGVPGRRAGIAYDLTSGLSAALPVGPQLHGTASEYVRIAGRNTTVCALLILAAHVPDLRSRWPRNVVDVAVALVLMPTTFVIAGHRGGMAYLPDAQLELTAVALSAAWWWRHHQTPPDPAETRQRLTPVVLMLLIAAALETCLVPHR
jgi:hypothetical protein